MEGLEPPYLTASDPKSDVSTNFTTSGGDKTRLICKWAANVGHLMERYCRPGKKIVKGRKPEKLFCSIAVRRLY